MTQNVPYGNPNNLYDDNQKWEGRMSVKKGKVHLYSSTIFANRFMCYTVLAVDILNALE
ncbi:TPA: hypothetical protein PW924_002532 [Mannheimia haemolytica]|nr:hypothetical protein [Mannheimia haemolytica]